MAKLKPTLNDKKNIMGNTFATIFSHLLRSEVPPPPPPAPQQAVLPPQQVVPPPQVGLPAMWVVPDAG